MSQNNPATTPVVAPAVVLDGPPPTSVPSFANDIKPRLEIDAMVKDEDLLNIYLQALAELQTNDDATGQPLWKNDALSYFQLAAVHGFKLPKWDIEPKLLDGLETLPQFALKGFCTHSSVLFPTWHRVYLSLYEQRLVAIATSIAGRYVDVALRKKYTDAAARLRLPYWDPMVVRGIKDNEPQWFVPYILGVTHVWLRLPGAGKETSYTKRPNPLYSYVFPPTSKTKELVKDIPFSYQGWTVRCPVWVNPHPTGDQKDKRMKSDHAQLTQQLFEGQLGSSNLIKIDIVSKFEQLSKLFMLDDLTWNEFSNTNWRQTVPGKDTAPSTAGAVGSIEGWHDDIHGLVGRKYAHLSKLAATQGSMGDTPTSAFDPIFWLHHANCDRLVALYQMTHPGQWLDKLEPTTDLTAAKDDPNESPWRKRDPSFPLGSPPDKIPAKQPAMRPEPKQFSSTPLLPFRKDRSATSWWTSDDVRDWTKLGYSYDGIKYAAPAAPKEDSDKIKEEGKALATYKFGWMTIENFLNKNSKNGTFPAFLEVEKYKVFGPGFARQYDGDNRPMPATHEDPATEKLQYDDYAGDQVTKELETKDPFLPDVQPVAEKLVSISASTVVDAKVRVDPKAKPDATITKTFEELKKKPFYEWDLLMTVKKFELAGSFSVFFFFGDYPKADSSTWHSHPNLVSMNYVFANSNFLNCANCMADGLTIYIDSSCLTPALVSIIAADAALPVKRLTSLDSAEVTPYLTKNLDVAFLDKDGKIIEAPSSFKIKVIRRLVTWNSNGTASRGPSEDGFKWRPVVRNP